LDSYNFASLFNKQNFIAMEFITSAVPMWVSISFIISFPIFFFMLANAAQQAAIDAKFDNPQHIKRNVLVFYGAYLLYVSIMSFTGFFQVNTLPPRILLFTALPLAVFYFTYVLSSDWFQKIFKAATLESLIRLHTFRFVGVFFLITYHYGALPKVFAIGAGVGDILAAFTAIFVANKVERKVPNAQRIAYYWNIFGLLDILNVIITAIITTRLSMVNGSQSVVEIASFPFSWIPAIAPATIIFLHVLIFKKLKYTK
jgi:hypothetical protein